MTTPPTPEQVDAVLVQYGLQTVYMLADDAGSARLKNLAATIARLEGENANAHESLRAIAAGVNRAFHECAVLVVQEDLVDGIPPQVVREVNTLVEMLLAERTRADAAERRVEAVTPLVEMAFFEGYGVPHNARTDHAEKTWRASKVRRALAAASGALRCAKVPHTGDGYMHDESDDTPYSVDGLLYCGRCHGLCYQQTQQCVASAAASGDTATTEG